MKSFVYTINDPVGLHARPAGLLVKEAQKYQSAVTIGREGEEKTADLKRLFATMGLGIKCGDAVRVTVEGPDEEAAAQELQAFLQANL